MKPALPIPMSSPDLTADEREAVLAVLNTSYLSMGPQIRAFEQAFCALTGRKHAIAVNSGTAGLHLCVRAAGISAGDYVITTPFSFVASTNALLFENAIPIFVDVDPLTGNIVPQAVQAAAEALISGRAAESGLLPRRGAASGGQLKAILPVDVFGQPADIDALRPIGLPIIEDSCEALGATYKGRPAGALGDYGVFAFYPNKQITTGEGGMIITDDDEAAEMMRALRNQGRAPGDTWLQHTRLGYNYRLDELSAALGVVQMRRLDELLRKRQRVAALYESLLADVDEVETLTIRPETTRMSWFVYVIRLAQHVERDVLAARLKTRGVPVRPYFTPIHLQPYMRERFGYQPGDFPVTEDLGRRNLALPFSSVMTENQVAYVVQSLKEALRA